ncbi:MAG: hypothetical protein COB39_02450 [Marinosulfonomonas sp.]|nr:MAG: hypothetical protein COB39_02450 [Marinosulfonomonas sp.]
MRPKLKNCTPGSGGLQLKMGFVTRAQKMSRIKRKEMINKDRTDLSLARQCKLLKVSRSSLYYVPVGFDAETLELMSEIDRIFTKFPFLAAVK